MDKNVAAETQLKIRKLKKETKIDDTTHGFSLTISTLENASSIKRIDVVLDESFENNVKSFNNNEWPAVVGGRIHSAFVIDVIFWPNEDETFKEYIIQVELTLQKTRIKTKHEFQWEKKIPSTLITHANLSKLATDFELDDDLSNLAAPSPELAAFLSELELAEAAGTSSAGNEILSSSPENPSPESSENLNSNIPEILNIDNPILENPVIPNVEDPILPNLVVPNLENLEVPNLENPAVPNPQNQAVPNPENPNPENFAVPNLENPAVPNPENEDLEAEEREEEEDVDEPEEKRKRVEPNYGHTSYGVPFRGQEVDRNQRTAKFICEYCNGEFDSIKAKLAHRAGHTKDVDYHEIHKCTRCKKTYGIQKSYESHVRVCHNGYPKKYKRGIRRKQREPRRANQVPAPVLQEAPNEAVRVLEEA